MLSAIKTLGIIYHISEGTEKVFGNYNLRLVEKLYDNKVMKNMNDEGLIN